jgi:hypothetical protein
VAFTFDRCTFSGLSVTKSGIAVPVTPLGSCEGGVFQVGGPAAIDVVMVLSDGTTLVVSLSSATQNQDVVAAVPPADVDHQALFLGPSVPAGAVWIRHSVPTAGGYSYKDLIGPVSVGSISVAPNNCADVCNGGSLTMNLTLNGVQGTSPGTEVYSGAVQISASGDDPSCNSPADCSAGTSCNAVNESYSSYCTPTNASGAALGDACTSSSACASGYCRPPEGECSLVCKSDADCSGPTACMGVLGNTPHTECLRTCASKADCATLPSASVCVLRQTPDGKALTAGCEPPQGPTTFGQNATSASPCDASLIVGPNEICSHVCKTNADCAPPLPNCQPGTLSSGGTMMYTFCQ